MRRSRKSNANHYSAKEFQNQKSGSFQFPSLPLRVVQDVLEKTGLHPETLFDTSTIKFPMLTLNNTNFIS